LKKILIAISMFLFLFLAGDAVVAAPHHAFIDPRVLQDAQGGKTASFLVTLDKKANLSTLSENIPEDQRIAQAVNRLQITASQTQPEVIEKLEGLGVRYQAYWIANTIAVWGNLRQVEAIAQIPQVAAIEPNQSFEIPNTQSSNSPENPNAVQWNIAAINAPQVWSASTGQGIVYATADTGVEWDHPILRDNYRGWNSTAQQADHNNNWWDAIHSVTHGSICPANSPAPCDDQGHGTHVTGIGVGINGYGVAPGAKWIGCRNMDNGFGMPSTYIECLQFFMAPWDLQKQNPNPALHADIISNSYSCPVSEGCTIDNIHVLRDAVDAVRAAGIFMSVSAGNNGNYSPSDPQIGCGTINEPPALEQAVFTVGSVDVYGNIATTSSRGPVTIDGSNRFKPNIAAPGVGVKSSYLLTKGSYATLSGTSMAAPHVAGAVALLWSAYPNLRGKVNQTEALLESTAVPKFTTQTCGGDTATSHPNHVYGYGELDVYGAYQLFPLLTHFLYLPIVLP
jgi:subtilisin family serine protease